jgi:hypothetical protein
MHTKEKCPACGAPLRADGCCAASRVECRNSDKRPEKFDAKATGTIPAQQYRPVIERSVRTDRPPPMATSMVRVPNRSLSPRAVQAVTAPAFSKEGADVSFDGNPWKGYAKTLSVPLIPPSPPSLRRRVLPIVIVVCGVVAVLGLLLGYRLRIESQDARASGAPSVTPTVALKSPPIAPAQRASASVSHPPSSPQGRSSNP